MTGTATPEGGSPTALDAVVLAGGTSARLGGVDKARLRIDGERLVDRVVAAALSAIGAGGRCVVVGPADLGTAVPTVREEPVGRGPVAGIAAGLAAVRPGTGEVLVLACDLANPVAVVAALTREPLRGDGACLVDADGRSQWLAGRYRRDPLLAALARLESGGHDAGARRAVRELVRGLALDPLSAPAAVTADVDTWQDARAAGVDDRVRPGPSSAADAHDPAT